eukprot:9483797-Pyramimonas_sp.AAC.1
MGGSACSGSGDQTEPSHAQTLVRIGPMGRRLSCVLPKHGPVALPPGKTCACVESSLTGPIRRRVACRPESTTTRALALPCGPRPLPAQGWPLGEAPAVQQKGERAEQMHCRSLSRSVSPARSMAILAIF